MNTIRRMLVLLSPLALTGCVATEWILQNQEAIEGAGDTASGFGPYGAIASLAVTSIVGLSKWVEHKSTTKDLVNSVQKAKGKLDPKAKAILADNLHKYTPSKVKKVVSKIKGY